MNVDAHICTTAKAEQKVMTHNLIPGDCPDADPRPGMRWNNLRHGRDALNVKVASVPLLTQVTGTLKVAIGNVRTYQAGQTMTTSCAVTGTLTTATSPPVSRVLRDKRHVSNGGDELLLDVPTVADVDGTMTLTEVLVVNKNA